MNDTHCRFFGKVKKSEHCWEWQAGINRGGYGWFWFKKRPEVAHRISWILHNGKIPKNKFVLHHCDNRRCVNPKHLWIGTLIENNIDRDNKGRNVSHKGECHSLAKLSELDVMDIRNKYKQGGFSHRKLSSMFGVSNTKIYQIIHRKSWAHI